MNFFFFSPTSKTRLYLFSGVLHMTRLVLDPSTLLIELPRASESRLYRVRIIAQVVEYDEESCCLTVVKVPTVPQIHTTIVLDDIEDDNRVQIFLSNIIDRLNLDCIRKGAVVNIIGYYNGNGVNVVECDTVDMGVLMRGTDVDMMVEMSKMRDLD